MNRFKFFLVSLFFTALNTLAVSETGWASDWSSAIYESDNTPQAKQYFAKKPMAFNLTLAPDPVYQAIFNSVDRDNLFNQLKRTTGTEAVTVNGETYKISERYSPANKARFRAYWRKYYEDLGIPTQEFAYVTQHSVGEREGHNLEAVLPGKSADSIVIIVHYDSTGPWMRETENPGVDDDMTGMSIQMETARILAQRNGQQKYTVRFVAADYEEHTSPGLEGARQYAKYIQNLAATEGFKIIAALDNEQTGWNCRTTNECRHRVQEDTFDVFSCSGDRRNFSHPALGDMLAETAATYSQLKVSRGCIGANSDHYAMWEIDVPAVVYSEHDPFNNPHFDQHGGDTFDKVDQDYFFKIAQVGVTFAARLAGVE